jgi:hypothetical protein
LPLKANSTLDLVRIDGSILILLIFQKEEVARIDAKTKIEKGAFWPSASPQHKNSKI